ncbi:MAG: glutamate--tRNA ligase [Acidobacteriota bacterium]|nr:glutamate--tRNA ligase [Acidobacteriota bacterium]
MIRTRFAPSPTGYLHIGGVRTALFNWLFTKKHGGRFILRIDDTDRERNLDEALEPILHGFRWLGIDWDEGPVVDGDYGPYYQSQRHELYGEAVEKLLASGHAYRDFAKPEEIQAEREAAQREQQTFVYSRRWAAMTVADNRRFEAEGRQGVVRLAMPRTGVCTFDDAIRGQMEFEWAREQDHVIQRADGSCLYHLASVVDDQAMMISHVIRAEEHLSNTPRQIFIAESLGYSLPTYAHLPYVAEPGSKTKLSKRKLDKYLKQADFARLAEHGERIAVGIGLEVTPETFNPVIVDFYEEIGFLPDALLNYLLLLGWSLDDKTEFLTRDEMVQSFSLDRVQRSPASFDPVKLWTFQERYMLELSTDAKVDLVLPFLEKAGWLCEVDAEGRREVAAIVAAAGDRIKAGGDILDYGDFFVSHDRLVYDEKAFEKRLVKAADAPKLLAGFRSRLAAVVDFDAETLEQAMRDFITERDVKLGQIIHAVRVAVTGKAVGFGLFEVLEILGRQQVLARIDRALSLLDRVADG